MTDREREREREREKKMYTHIHAPCLSPGDALYCFSTSKKAIPSCGPQTLHLQNCKPNKLVSFITQSICAIVLLETRDSFNEVSDS
jgi:hypothetical protein